MCRRVTELASAPEAARLRAMVKSWGFSTGNAAIREMIPDFLESDTIQLYDATEEKFVRSLSFYPNLQIISLKNITVDSVFLGSPQRHAEARDSAPYKLCSPSAEQRDGVEFTGVHSYR